MRYDLDKDGKINTVNKNEENEFELVNKDYKNIESNNSLSSSEKNLFYLVSQDITRKWTMPIPNWSLILNQFLIYFNERLEKYL